MTGIDTETAMKIGLANDELKRENARLRAELDAVKAERDAAEKEVSILTFAAHMPDDYKFGLPSWINQRLWGCYIGMDISPEIQNQIESGILSFPDAPVWKENDRLRAELDAVKAERDAARQMSAAWKRSAKANHSAVLICKMLMED